VPAAKDALLAENLLFIVIGAGNDPEDADHEGAADSCLGDVADVGEDGGGGGGSHEIAVGGEGGVGEGVVVGVAELSLDVGDIVGGVLGGVRFLEGLERGVEAKPAATWDAGGRALAVDGVCAGVGVEEGEACLGLEGGVVFLLPLPEDVVDPAVVEEEDGVEGGGVVLFGD
jgi:hypothetical protein